MQTCIQGANKAENPGEGMAMHGLPTSGTVSKSIRWALCSFLEAEQSLWSARAQSLGVAVCQLLGMTQNLGTPIVGSEKHPRTECSPTGRRAGIQDTDVSG